MEPTRLFDLPEYQLETSPLPDMLAGKQNGRYVLHSTEKFVNMSHTLAANFHKRGIGYKKWTMEGRDKIAILSENRPEWMLIDLACQQAGAVLTPIYPTIHSKDMTHIFNEASIKWVFVSNQELYKKVHEISAQVPSITEIFSFNHIEGVANWKELLSEPDNEDLEEIQKIKEQTKPFDLATIIYTSGTSGTPKGVMLSHNNIISNVLEGYTCTPINKDGRALSFLPLNHVYERMMNYLYIYAGIPIYYAEQIDTVGENLLEVKPYLFATVPRLLEKVYEKIMETGRKLTGAKKKIFFWALKIGSKYEVGNNKGVSYRIQLNLARKLVFSKWQEALGGKVEAIITGSAACQVRLLRLFTAAGIPILEGYGLTETSPVISVNRMEPEDRKFGTVGIPFKNVEVKIDEEGVIYCKGPNVMMGYYKNVEQTTKVLQDGWFNTEDIGEWVDGRFLKIKDRKKELFKTSGGKYIAPLPIETKMLESPYIQQIMLVGDNYKFASALIVPDFKHILSKLGVSRTDTRKPEELVDLPEVINLIEKEIEKYNPFFGHVEQVKKFRLLPHEWTIEAGELTPTLKMKRKVILEKYKDEIQQIYNG